MRTARDLVDYLTDYLGENAGAGGQVARQAKQSVLDGLTELANVTNWSYYYRPGRIATVAPYTTGTITYLHTGGTYERQVTLASGTWPTWATYGLLFISNVAYEVEERKSSTVLTLTSTSNPGSDLAAGTAYTALYRDYYPLPTDFKSLFGVTVAGNLSTLDFVHPSRWRDLILNFRSQGIPVQCSVVGDPNYLGQMSIGFFPFPDAVRQVDYLYQRRPREVQVWDYHDGSLATTASSATVTGSGTNFTSRMQGCTLRISSDAVNYPTGLDGAQPYLWERQILAVDSTTQLRLDQTVDTTYSVVKYVISDPVDVDDGQMRTALMRCCEKHLATMRRQKEAPMLAQAFQEALILAKAADSRFNQRWDVDADRFRVPRKSMPLGSDSG